MRISAIDAAKARCAVSRASPFIHAEAEPVVVSHHGAAVMLAREAFGLRGGDVF